MAEKIVAAVLTGRKTSRGFPGKNMYPVLGRPLAYYPLKAAKDCIWVNRVYMSIEVIRRPPELCSDTALSGDVFVHAYEVIKGRVPDKEIEFLVLLMCNAPMVSPQILSDGIKALRENPAYDSAVTVSKYNMWSPARARRIGGDGLLHPFVPPEAFSKGEKISSDRNSQGDVWFADMGASIVRPRCLQNLEKGVSPQKWMGRSIYPLKQWGGLDVDYKWQLPQVEYWFKEHQDPQSDEKW
jgi:hypothetical protein